jgi:phosphoserine phosphatase
MVHNTIAIIADCDGTLAPDTTDQLLTHFNVKPEEFWPRQVQPLVKAEWDEHLAYMQKLIELSRTGGPLEGLTADRLVEIAAGLEFYPGVPEGLITLRDEIQGTPEFRDVGIRVEFYVISAGIGDMLRASALASAAHRIWACDFAYDCAGKLSHLKNVISFTDKTRFLYMVNKGKVGEEYVNRQYAVNEPMDREERPVPFENMVYIGDGPTDIPCMSLVTAMGGYVMGILGKDKPYKAWALGYGRRINITVPPDFSVGGYGYAHLKETILNRAKNIREQMSSSGPTPGH